MNKQELVTAVTERARRGKWDRRLTKADIEAVLVCLGDVLLEDVLCKGETVSLPRVGKFAAKQAKTGKPFWVFDFSREAEAIALREQAEVAK